jgi:hypothetical protein
MEDRLGRGYPYCGNMRKYCTKASDLEREGMLRSCIIKIYTDDTLNSFETHCGILLMELSRWRRYSGSLTRIVVIEVTICIACK